MDVQAERPKRGNLIRRYVAAALPGSTLVAAWPAQAGPESVRLCGQSACVRIADPAAYAAILRRPPASPPSVNWRTRSMPIAISAGGPAGAWPRWRLRGA